MSTSRERGGQVVHLDAIDQPHTKVLPSVYRPDDNLVAPTAELPSDAAHVHFDAARVGVVGGGDQRHAVSPHHRSHCIPETKRRMIVTAQPYSPESGRRPAPPSSRNQ